MSEGAVLARPLDPLDFFKILEGREGPCLVAFVKPACGACRSMKAALEAIAVPSYLVDAEDGPGLVAEYEVFHLPALFLWCDGEYHARIHCPPTPVAVVQALAEALARGPEPEP